MNYVLLIFVPRFIRIEGESIDDCFQKILPVWEFDRISYSPIDGLVHCADINNYAEPIGVIQRTIQ